MVQPLPLPGAVVQQEHPGLPQLRTVSGSYSAQPGLCSGEPASWGVVGDKSPTCFPLSSQQIPTEGTVPPRLLPQPTQPGASPISTGPQRHALFRDTGSWHSRRSGWGLHTLPYPQELSRVAVLHPAGEDGEWRSPGGTRGRQRAPTAHVAPASSANQDKKEPWGSQALSPLSHSPASYGRIGQAPAQLPQALHKQELACHGARILGSVPGVALGRAGTTLPRAGSQQVGTAQFLVHIGGHPSQVHSHHVSSCLLSSWSRTMPCGRQEEEAETRAKVCTAHGH